MVDNSNGVGFFFGQIGKAPVEQSFVNGVCEFQVGSCAGHEEMVNVLMTICDQDTKRKIYATA